MTDLALERIEAARAGGASDIDQLIETIWPDAYRIARGMLGDSHGAEDAAQDACVIVYRSISSLREAAAFRVWFYRIVVRAATRIKRRRSQREPEIEEVAITSDESTRLDVWHALSKLSPGLRAVVVLRYFAELSSREIAAVLRIPDGTVRFQLMIARRRLRPLLADKPLPCLLSTDEAKIHAI